MHERRLARADGEKRELSCDQPPLAGELPRAPAAKDHLRPAWSGAANDLGTAVVHQQERVVALARSDEDVAAVVSTGLSERPQPSELSVAQNPRLIGLLQGDLRCLDRR